jgi:hypothetical protein
MLPGVHCISMSTGNDNRVDRTAAATPAGNGVGGRVSRTAKPRATPETPHDVMVALLGENNLSSSLDAGGNDPYNATGRQLRR